MAENAKQQEEGPSAEVVDLFEYVRNRTAAPATPEELDEYRRMWPLVMQMLREWEIIKRASGCPIAHRLTMQD